MFRKVIVQDNLAYGVGGIHNEGNLQLTDSLIQRNATQGFITDAGRGIQNTGVMTATGVTFRDNHGFNGGALYNVAHRPIKDRSRVGLALLQRRASWCARCVLCPWLNNESCCSTSIISYRTIARARICQGIVMHKRTVVR